MGEGQNFNNLRLPTVHYSDRSGNRFSWHEFPAKMTRFMNLNPIWGYSITGVPKIASALFKKDLYLLLTVYYAHPKLERKWLLHEKTVFAFPVSSQMPQGCTWESRSCMSPLFHCGIFFLLHNPGRGKRAEVTHTQRLICLLVKRNFSLQFRLDPLINSDGLARHKKEGDR